MNGYEGSMTLIVGGTASGKSEYAEKLALQISDAGGTNQERRTLVYLATLSDASEDSRRRIAVHKRRREQIPHILYECWSLPDLKEVTGNLPKTGEPVVLLDCLSSSIAGILFSTDTKDASITDPRAHLQDLFSAGDHAETVQSTAKKIETAILALEAAAAHLIIVSDLVFSDGMVWEQEMEDYIQILGTVLRNLAKKADKVVEVVCGIPLELKGGI